MSDLRSWEVPPERMLHAWILPFLNGSGIGSRDTKRVESLLFLQNCSLGAVEKGVTSSVLPVQISTFTERVVVSPCPLLHFADNAIIPSVLLFCSKVSWQRKQERSSWIELSQEFGGCHCDKWPLCVFLEFCHNYWLPCVLLRLLLKVYLAQHQTVPGTELKWRKYDPYDASKRICTYLDATNIVW